MHKNTLHTATWFLLLFIASAYSEVVHGSRVVFHGRFNVSWQLDTEAQNIAFKLDLSDIGKWIGIGFAHDRNTLMKEAPLTVISFDSQNHPKLDHYVGTEKNGKPKGPFQQYNKEYKMTAQAVNAQGTSVSFSRNLGAPPGSDLYYAPIAHHTMMVIVAIGSSGTLEKHVETATFAVNFWEPSIVYPNPLSNTAVFGQYNTKGVSVNWFTEKRNEVHVTLQICANTLGWVALGLGALDREQMRGATIVTGTCTNNKLSTFETYYTNQRTGFPSQKITTTQIKPLSCHQHTATRTTCMTFKYPTFDTLPVAAKPTNSIMNMIWAFASNNEQDMSYHAANRGNFYANLLDSSVIDSYRAHKLLMYLHGAGMTIAWALLAPLAIFIAKYTKNWWPAQWMWVHIGLLVAMLVGMIVSLVLSLAGKSWSFLFDTQHAIHGWIILCMVPLQMILGVVADKLFDPARKQVPFFPDILHWIVGGIAWMLSLLNIYIGMVMMNIHVVLQALYVLWVVVLIALFVFTPRPDDSHHAANDHHGHEEAKPDTNQYELIDNSKHE